MNKEVSRLVREGFAVVGMIDELRAKLALLKSKMDVCELSELERQVRQMAADLGTYSGQLAKIGEELKTHGVLKLG